MKTTFNIKLPPNYPIIAYILILFDFFFWSIYLEYTFRWVTPNIKYIDFEKINLKGVFLRLKFLIEYVP